MAVSLAIRAEEVKANATAVEDRYRVTNSSTRDCRGHVFCGEYGEEDCKSGCLCYTGNATEPFLCISSMEADFYKTASRYS
ncbi:hypothetical protein MRX96_032099 [Rhipicephalus microplus]